MAELRKVKDAGRRKRSTKKALARRVSAGVSSENTISPEDDVFDPERMLMERPVLEGCVDAIVAGGPEAIREFSRLLLRIKAAIEERRNTAALTTITDAVSIGYHDTDDYRAAFDLYVMAQSGRTIACQSAAELIATVKAAQLSSQ